MKRIFLLCVIALAVASCQPCEQECKFVEGQEVTIKSKSFVNNGGVIDDVCHHMDCSCYYTVAHHNMINIVTYRDYDEHELEE